jgi:hypothetical protein
MNRRIIITLVGVCCSFSLLYAQSPNILGQADSTLRPVVASVPFAAFTPDARSAGLGDAGAALSPDANSVFWGAAKLAQSTKNYGVAFSYTPWLRNITEDMQFIYASGFTKIGKNQALGFGVMYFDHGKFESRDARGQSTGDLYSNEFYGTVAYSRKLSDNFSMGLNLKYIYSNLAGGYVGTAFSIKPASTAAGDISFFYQSDKVDEATGKGWHLASGLLLQNIGGKVNYGNTETGFIPTTFKFGGAATRHIDTHNKITLTADVNKLMIPTPPVRDVNRVITRGKNPYVNSIQGMFQSWGDAPDGFGEEIKEFTVSVGAEYWYNDLFAVRMGYFNEARSKGDRKYLTVGFGARIQQRYGFDFAYLIPQKQGSPLANTFRFSLLIDMFKKQIDEETPEETTTN